MTCAVRIDTIRKATGTQVISKRKATGAQVSKRIPNFTGAEVEVMLQGVEVKRGILFSSVNEGYKPSQKNEAWDEITREVNVVSGQGRTLAEIKKEMGRCEIGGQKNNCHGE